MPKLKKNEKYLFLKEKNDYIQLLEDFIKKNLFTHPPPDSSLLKISSKAPISFLELKEHMQNKEKSQAGPVLKAMLFGFPNPRTYSFNNQKSKSSNGDNTSGGFIYCLNLILIREKGSPTKDNYANMKICEPGCIVI